jgi:hypothetical protein
MFVPSFSLKVIISKQEKRNLSKWRFQVPTLEDHYEVKLCPMVMMMVRDSLESLSSEF